MSPPVNPDMTSPLASPMSPSCNNLKHRSHTHTLLLISLDLLLWISTSLMFDIFGTIYLCSLLYLTPLTFSIGRNRRSSIVAGTYYCFAYSTTLTVISLLCQFVPLFVRIPDIWYSHLATVGLQVREGNVYLRYRLRRHFSPASLAHTNTHKPAVLRKWL